MAPYRSKKTINNQKTHENLFMGAMKKNQNILQTKTDKNKMPVNTYQPQKFVTIC